MRPLSTATVIEEEEGNFDEDDVDSDKRKQQAKFKSHKKEDKVALAHSDDSGNHNDDGADDNSSPSARAGDGTGDGDEIEDSVSGLSSTAGQRSALRQQGRPSRTTRTQRVSFAASPTTSSASPSAVAHTYVPPHSSSANGKFHSAGTGKKSAGRSIAADDPSLTKYVDFVDTGLVSLLSKSTPQAEIARIFCIILGVAHTVVAEKDDKDSSSGKISYRAESPDENALVRVLK